MHAAPWWLILSLPAAAGLVSGVVIAFWAPEVKGPGVTEVILAVARRQSAIRHRVTLLKALVTSMLIGAGASVGREGPIVLIGASVGSSLAQVFKISPELRRVCLAAGAAAGISATFNAPIAGTLFAVEIILLDIEIAYISHIIIASVTASVLSGVFWGDFPTFHIMPFEISHYWELSLYLLLGVLAGFLAIGFVRLTYALDSMFGKMPLPIWIKPGIGGLLLGVMGIFLPGVMGVGYDTINLTLAGSLALDMAILLLMGKLLATALCIGSGMSGGIFAPSLVLGATLGTVVGLGFEVLFPETAIQASHYALVGMGAVVAGATLAPMTAVLTIFELTDSHTIILPLMVGCISSSLIVRFFFGYSAYEMKLVKQGINVVRGHDVGILRNLRAEDVMTDDYGVLRVDTTLSEIVEEVMESPATHFMVLNSKDELTGIISLSDLKESLHKYEDLKPLVIAADLMNPGVVSLSSHDNLERALYLFEGEGVSCLPVTDPDNPKVVRGLLKKEDLLQAYRERTLKDRLLSRRLD